MTMTYNEKKHAKSAWVSHANDIVEKPWGFETRWSGFSGVHGKTLFIRAGERTSFKYNQSKTEVLMLRSGSAEAFFGNELSLDDPIGNPMKTEQMKEGDTLLVQSGCPYRVSAIENCEIFEIGDNASDHAVMLEDDYGRMTNEKNA